MAGLCKPLAPHMSCQVAPGPALAAASVSSQLGFSWEYPGPAQVAATYRLFCRLCSMAPGRTQVGADLGLHHLGNLWANEPHGQLQTMLEHHHPAPAQLILHGGQRLVVRGHSQSLQLTGLGKSLPLICQQQSKLNYKRRVFSAHMKGEP